MWGWNVIRDEYQVKGLYISSTRHIRDGEGLLQLSSIYADKVEVRLIHLLHEIEAIFIAICKLGHVSFFADLYKEKE